MYTEYSLLLLKNCSFDSPSYQKVINLFVNLFQIQYCLLINSVTTHTKVEEPSMAYPEIIWIHAFPKSISAMWNVNSICKQD